MLLWVLWLLEEPIQPLATHLAVSLQHHFRRPRIAEELAKDKPHSSSRNK